MTTIHQALEKATLSLAKADQTNARLDAQVLLSHTLHAERSFLYAYPEQVLTSEQEQEYRTLIERRSRGEPIAYLTGHQEFYGLDFLVDKRVLIPRPETELVVEAALNACKKMFDAGHTPIVADIGTGSGAIPVTLAVLEPRLPYLYACDISTDALVWLTSIANDTMLKTVYVFCMVTSWRPYLNLSIYSQPICPMSEQMS